MRIRRFKASLAILAILAILALAAMAAALAEDLSEEDADTRYMENAWNLREEKWD